MECQNEEYYRVQKKQTPHFDSSDQVDDNLTTGWT